MSPTSAIREALACDLDPYSRQGDLLPRPCEQKIAHYDKLIREGLDGFEKQLLLLQTIPGIDKESASALGPDLGVFGSAVRCAA